MEELLSLFLSDLLISLALAAGGSGGGTRCAGAAEELAAKAQRLDRAGIGISGRLDSGLRWM